MRPVPDRPPSTTRASARRPSASPGFAFGAQQFVIEREERLPRGRHQRSTSTRSTPTATGSSSAEAATSVDGQSDPLRGRRPRGPGDPGRPGDDPRRTSQVLRDPLGDGPRPEAALADTPAVLWVAANVHGDEESGADAALQVLYELAARDRLRRRRRSSTTPIVVILPIQNPDGREIEPATQPLRLRHEPRLVRADPAGDRRQARGPPAVPADALHRRPRVRAAELLLPARTPTPSTTRSRTRRTTGSTSSTPGDRRRSSTRERHQVLPRGALRLLRIVFGDTVPTAGFHAAGMTFEKENGDPIADREHEHFTVDVGVARRRAPRPAPRSWPAWHDSYVEAYEQGVAGDARAERRLRARATSSTSRSRTSRSATTSCSTTRTGRYELAPARPATPADGRRRLPARRSRSRSTPSIRTATRRRRPTLPAGTYWIPMAQGQKHWIQAMLHEETWIPFDVTYDVTAWSNPLLMNLRRRLDRRGRRPGRDPRAARRRRRPGPAAGRRPVGRPVRDPQQHARVRGGRPGDAICSEQVWDLPYTDVDGRPTSSRRPRPGRSTSWSCPTATRTTASQALGAKGKRALRDWVNDGGRIVAWQGGVEVAVKAGVIDRQVRRLPHEHARARSSGCRSTTRSPLATRHRRPGLGHVPGRPDDAAGPRRRRSRRTRPPATPDYATSGLAIGVDTLAGTAAVVDEAVGDGRVVSLLDRPELPRLDRRAPSGSCGTRSSAGRPPASARRSPAGSRARAAAEKAAADAAADRLLDLGSAIRIRVAAADATATAKVLAAPRRRGRPPATSTATSLFLVANREDLSYDEHPFFTLVVADLAEGRHHAAGGQPAVAPRRRTRARDPGPSGRWTPARASRYHPATCTVHTFYASDRPLTMQRSPEAARLDAQEIKTAVAHQAAAQRRRRGAVREPGRPGAGPGRRRAACRQPARADLRGRARRAVERLALAALAIGSTTSRRSGRS